MNEENGLPELPSSNGEGSVRSALFVAFLPLALLLVVGFLVQLSFFHWTVSVSLLFLVGVVSVTCCFKGARILFARKTTAAVFGGIALIIFNGLIAICSFLGMIVFWDEY